MSNIVENPQAYFRQFVPERDTLLKELESEAAREHIPIVGPVVGALLYLLARAVRAERILEIGTATGYSAIYLARAMASDRGRLVTLENDPAMARRAGANFRQAGLAQRIEIRVGDALTELTGLEEGFDIIFLDIDKAHYEPTLPHCRRLLRKGGLLVADNVGFKDADPFNRHIHSSPDWLSVSLFAYLPHHSPENDGLCLALRL
jgi:predicted O-methyltransferase YrrM